MTKEKDISFIKPYHKSTQIESFVSNALYDKFLNWISGEFDLYLKYEHNGLEVYFPNGSFSIKQLTENKKGVLIEINIKSKDFKSINIIGSQIISIHHQIESIYSKPVEEL